MYADYEDEKHDGLDDGIRILQKLVTNRIDHYSTDYELEMKVINPDINCSNILQSLVVQYWPDPISLKFVYDILQQLSSKLRALELVLDDVLYLGVVVSQVLLGQRMGVHIRGQGTILDWGVRRLEHLRPLANMMLVNFFNNIVQFKL